MKRKWKSVTILIVAAVLFVAVIQMGKGYEVYSGENKISQENNWTLESDHGEKTPVQLPYAYSGEERKVYRFSSILTCVPEEDTNFCAFFNLNHSFFRVYLDGEEIYHYTESDVPQSSHSPGNACVAVPLPQDCTGKQFVLEVWSVLDEHTSCWLSLPEFGDYDTYMRCSFLLGLPQGILALLFCAFGILLIGIGFFVSRTRSSNRAGYLGLFSVLFGMYSLTENTYLMFLIGNPYPVYLLNFILFAAFPLPLLHFLQDFTKEKFWKWYRIVALIGNLNFLIQCVLHFADLMDFREMLPVTHGVVVVCVVLVIVTLLLTDTGQNPQKRQVLLSFIPVGVGMLIDLVNYYSHILPTESATFFSQIGIVIFTFIHLWGIIADIFHTYRAGIEQMFYKQMAFKDSLTGLSNRAAFKASSDVINNHREKYKQVLCFCADIDDLKRVNDELGHAAGDELICRVADCLREAYGTYGTVYRIGGDEFTGLLHDLSVQEAEALAEKMYAEMQRTTSMGALVHFSIGFSMMTRRDRDVSEAMKRADQEMYEEKRRKKQQELQFEIDLNPKPESDRE
ncbi:MAG: diguanylate cyclase [Firmicutes bacterium]|nr:diguanylate cyclase [Bacillota bacterium]